MSKVLISRFISFNRPTANTNALLHSIKRFVEPGSSHNTPTLFKSSRSPFTQRSFSHSPALKKKKDKVKSNAETRADSTTSNAVEDPFDLSQLEAGIADALSRFKNDLSKLRAGGRLNPESIENLRVSVTKGGNETVRLGDVAQVVPKGGRMVTLLVTDEDVSDGTSFE